MPDIEWLSRLLLGTIFILSGTFKLARWRQFGDSLAALELLPRRFVRAVAAGLPPVEMAVGIAVLAGWRLPITGPLLLAMLFCFLAALALYRLRGGKELSCGCFADFEHKQPTSSLILRNLLLLVSGLPLLRPAQQPAPERGWEEWLIGSTVVCGSVMIWILLGRLVQTILLLRAENDET